MLKRKFFWLRETATKPQGVLADRLAKGPLAVGEALGYAIALAEALREVHSRGGVHAFLEPAGVAITKGQVRLVPSGPVTLSPYFSPEQVAGHDLDARSDIFSLGAIMYEMLSGRRAFHAASKPALRTEILDREPAPVENLPPALARLVQRCLEKKPARRIQRLEILLAELKLQAILAGDASPAEAPEAAPPSADSPCDPTSPAAWTDRVCRMCGARDVHWSPPDGRLESVLMRLGCEIGRCYRCYYRFLEVWGFTIEKPRTPIMFLKPGPEPSPARRQ